MYVIFENKLEKEPTYEVGYWQPDDTFYIDSIFETKILASLRVNFLNGGDAVLQFDFALKEQKMQVLKGTSK